MLSMKLLDRIRMVRLEFLTELIMFQLISCPGSLWEENKPNKSILKIIIS